MIKKLLLIMALVSSVFAANPQVSIYNYDGEKDYYILYNGHVDDGQFEAIPKSSDWVGVYKKGASNDWGNVVKWSWAKNLFHMRGDQYTYSINIEELPAGEYDIRYFFNNSYTTAASKTVTVSPANHHAYVKVTQPLQDGYPYVDYDASYAGDKTWIGVYKKGTSNAWNNVLAWTWVKKIGEGVQEVHIPNLQNGTYELRLFYNNSYKLEAKTEFIINYAQNEPKISVARQRDFGILFETTTSGKGNKDWVGLYKIGASNSWDNVQAWSWVDVEPHGYGKGFSIDGLAAGEYELRLFYHNSYKVEATKRVSIHF